MLAAYLLYSLPPLCLSCSLPRSPAPGSGPAVRSFDAEADPSSLAVANKERPQMPSQMPSQIGTKPAASPYLAPSPPLHAASAAELRAGRFLAGAYGGGAYGGGAHGGGVCGSGVCGGGGGAAGSRGTAGYCTTVRKQLPCKIIVATGKNNPRRQGADG